MAIIYRTTLTPSKTELLSAWLPSRPWYGGESRAAELVKAGGFRLDDPAGEVGIEFLVARHGEGDESTSYLAPMTYRDSPLEEAEDALIGTTEHGVLGRRWVYDGARDPVLVAQLAALLCGKAEPQAQSIDGTPDPTVLVTSLAQPAGPVEDFAVSDDADGTEIRIRTGNATSTVHVSRVLEPVTGPQPEAGQVTATWRRSGEDQVRGVFARTRPAAASA